MNQTLRILQNAPASLNSNFKVVGVVSRKGRNCLRAECVHCGSIKIYQKSNLSKSKSCGCMTKQILRDHQKKHGLSKIYGKETPEYKTWRSMIARCKNVNHKSFEAYGGRGIGVCSRWESFEKFFLDMGLRPKDMALGRIDNDKGYSPSNCRWETPKQQARNRRGNHNLTVMGETKTISEWSEITGILHCTISRRVEMGWTPRQAVFTPVNGPRIAA